MGWPGTASRVAAPSVITEAIPRPTTASVSSGSSGSRGRVRGSCTGALGSLIGLWDWTQRAQNVFDVPATNFSGLPNHCEAISRAIGAAVSAPKPPCCTVTAITIGRLGSPT